MLFSVGRLPVHSYPAMLYVGVVTGTLAAYPAAVRLHLPLHTYVAAILILLAPALAGGRLWFVATHWDLFRRSPGMVLGRQNGGLVIYGGLLMAVVASVPVLAVLSLPFLPFWDAAAVTMLCGVFFTRFGCLLSGCCGGRPASGWLALRLPDHRGRWCPRYPTQLMEAALALLLLGGAEVMLHTAVFSGAVFALGLGGYGVGRSMLELVRERRLDEERGLFTPRTVPIMLVAASLTLTVSRLI